MFSQSPHPLYTALLNNKYSLRKMKDSEFYVWKCLEERLIVRVGMGTLYISDPKTSQKATFNWEDGFRYKPGNNSPDNIFEVIKQYAEIIKESLNNKNIEVVKLILYGILKNYPHITRIGLLKNQQIVDQNLNYYKINNKEVFDFISDFYFIENIKLSHILYIKNFSNHENLENFIEIEEIKKANNIKVSIKKLPI